MDDWLKDDRFLPEFKESVMSLLEIDDAFNVSLTSREWRRMLYNCAVVILKETELLGDKDGRTMLQFKNLVELLLMNENRFRIEKLELWVSLHKPDISSDDLHRWLDRILSFQISNLSLRQLSPYTTTDRLLPRMFLSNSLTTLSLSNFSLSESLKCNLPNLNSLSLESFSSSSPRFVAELIKSCPELRNLSLLNVNGPVMPKFGINSPFLEVLILQHIRFAKQIKIHSPRVTRFTYQGSRSLFITSAALRSLKLFEFNPISIVSTVKPEELIAIWEGLEKVTDLKLLGDAYSALASNQTFVSQFPTRFFSYVRNLELHVRQRPDDVKLLSQMLNCFPNLRDLKISFQSHWYKSPVVYQILEGGDYENHQHLEEIGQFQGYLFDRLEEVQIEGFACEDENVLKLIKSLVKNSRNLRKVVIRYSHSIGSSSEFLESITQRILGFPRASAQSVMWFL